MMPLKNEKITMQHECYFCHNKTLEKLIQKFKPGEQTAQQFIFAVHDFISNNRDIHNPVLATEIQRIAGRYLEKSNLYAEEKQQANDMLLSNYEHWQNIVEHSDQPFYTAAKLAVIGNIIDYGAHSVGKDITKQIDSLYQKDLAINHVSALQKAVAQAENILYLGDNCGEIVFDKLFIETMKHPKVTFAVRGKPVINDATLEEAKQVGMQDVCQVISNGADAPSTLLDLCSKEFLQAFNEADLIVSKGQGNFEGLMTLKHPNLYFLLIAKCNPMAKFLNVQKNDMVITRL